MSTPNPDLSTALISAPALETLERLAREGRALCPSDVDAEVWAGGVLDDLVRITELLGGAVTQMSGRANDAVAAQSEALASVIAGHRNVCLGR